MNPNSSVVSLCYRVLYTKRSKKKHKTFSDGILVRKNKKLHLMDVSGKSLVQKVMHTLNETLGPGSVTNVTP